MNKTYKTYLYILLSIQFIVLIIMLFIAYFGAGSFSSQTTKVLQNEAVNIVEDEMETRINLVFLHLEKEKQKIIDEATKIARVTVNRLNANFILSGREDKMPENIQSWLPLVHNMAYGRVLELVVYNKTDESILRFMGNNKVQDLSSMYDGESLAEAMLEADVCERLIFGQSTLYVCNNPIVTDEMVKEYVYDLIYDIIQEENALLWVNEILNFDGGDDYARRLIYPLEPEQEGQYLSTSIQDSKGNFFYAKELNGVKENNDIFQTYFSTDSKTGEVIENAMYARLYKPYNWIFVISKPLSEIKAYANELSVHNNEFIRSLMLKIMKVTGLVFVLGCTIIIIAHKRNKTSIDTYIKTEIMLDELSGLYTRKYFYEKAIDFIKKNKNPNYIVRVNICNFKIINDLYGVENGDKLLYFIGEIIKENAEKYGFVAARFTADHFYLCIPKTVFDKIHFRRQINLPWLDIDVYLVYGVYPVDETKDIPINIMCDRADMAITTQKAESSGISGGFAYYNDRFRQQLLRDQKIEMEMVDALDNSQFCIYIQPKYQVATGALVGGEALVRWMHPEQGIIPPTEFIPVFERNGFIRNLDYFVWEQCCAFIKELKLQGLSVPPISINVSRIHFYGTELQSKLLELLSKYDLSPKDIELEITETVYAERPDLITGKCSKLRDAGFRIAMDDFGSGYSSLNMLKQLPLDVIKMDLQFLSGTEDNESLEKGQSILRNIIHMTQELHLQTVVEGVETKSQKDFICDIGDCVAQGFYYSKPISTNEFKSLLV